MTALKRSLAQESGETATKLRRKAADDTRQRNLLLPMEGKAKPGTAPVLGEINKKRRKA